MSTAQVINEQKLEAFVGKVVSECAAALSVLCCMPNAIAQGGVALGTIATDQQLRDVVVAGGLSQFTRVTASPTNRVFQARP